MVRPRSWFYRLSAAPLLLVLLTPLVVHSGLFFPFVSGKVFYFRTLVEVSLAFYLVLAYRAGEFRVQTKTILMLAGLFAGTQLVAAVAGVDPSRSLWGELERGEGLLTLFHLLAFVVLLVALFRSPEDWQLLLASWLLVAILVAGIAFFESQQSRGIHRPGSTLGNPTFLASYLLLSLFMALWMSAASRSVAVKTGSLILSVCFVAVLFLTATRSALAGAVAGGTCILLALWVSQPGRSRCRLTGLFLIVLAFSLACFFFFSESQLADLTVVKRLSSTSLDQGTARFRVLVWGAAIDAFRDRPWFGFGPENFDVAFNRHFPPELFTLSARETWVDRSHNSLIEVAVASGAAGVAAYLSFYGAILISLGRRWLRFRRTSSLILLGGFFAHFVDSLFSVANLATQMGFWLLVACVTNGAEHARSEVEPARVRTNSGTLAVALGALAVLLAGIWHFNLRPALTCRELGEGVAAARSGSHDLAIQHFWRAVEKGSVYTTDARKVTAETVLGWLEGGPASPEVQKTQVDFAIRELEQAVRNHPLDLKGRTLLTMLYNRSASRAPERVDLALASAGEALRLSPTRPATYFEQGQAYLFKKDFTNALASFGKAVELVPGSFEARWNRAVALVVAGRETEAEVEFNKLRELGFDLSQVRYLRRLLAAYQTAGSLEKSQAVLEQLTALEPDNSLWPNLLKESRTQR